MNQLYFKSLLRTLSKTVLFSFFITIDLFCIFLDAKDITGQGFEEFGFVEWAQQIQLGICAIVLLTSIKKNEILQPAFAFMAGCIACGFVREFNNVLNDTFFSGAWMIPILLIGVATIYSLYKHRENILAAFYHFSHTASFGITVAGFLTTFFFSRVMGTPGLWHLVLQNSYTRYAERAVEESTELFGYTVMIWGIIGYVAGIKRLKKIPAPAASLTSFFDLTVKIEEENLNTSTGNKSH